MGISWTIAITLTAIDRAAWLRSKAAPSAYADWPPLLAGAASAKPIAVSKLFAELEKRSGVRVDWTNGGLSVHAIVSNDDSFWIDRRTLLAAAVRASSAQGGEGELCIANAIDNTAENAVVVSAGGGAIALAGAKRAALQKRLRRVEEDLVDAEATRSAAAARERPFVKDERMRPAHAAIIEALRAADPTRVLAAGARSTHHVSLLPAHGKGGPLGALYGDANALVDALERGDARAHDWMAGTYLTASLEILADVDAERAVAIARDVLGCAKGRKNPTSQGFVDVALALSVQADGADAAAELAALRKAMGPAAVGASERPSQASYRRAPREARRS